MSRLPAYLHVSGVVAARYTFHHVIRLDILDNMFQPSIFNFSLRFSCLSCAMSVVWSLLVTGIIILVVVGLLFYFNVFNIQDTNKDAAAFFTKTGDQIKSTFNKHT